MTTTTAVTQSSRKPGERVLALARRARPQLEALARSSWAQVEAELALAIARNPTLAECDPASVVAALRSWIKSGLNLTTESYLVPFRRGGSAQCVWMVDYKALCRLAIQMGVVRAIDAYVVRVGDTFEYTLGTEARLVHTPRLADKPAPITHAYATAILNGEPIVRHFVVLSRAELDAMHERSRSASDKPLDTIPWFARKCAIRQLLQLFPQREMRSILDEEDAVTELGDMPAEEEVQHAGRE